jgi:hypothetical protein
MYRLFYNPTTGDLMSEVTLEFAIESPHSIDIDHKIDIDAFKFDLATGKLIPVDKPVYPVNPRNL